MPIPCLGHMRNLAIPPRKPHRFAEFRNSIGADMVLPSFFCTRLFLLIVMAMPVTVRPDNIKVILMGGQSNMEGTGITTLSPPAVQSQPPLQLYHSARLNSPMPPEQWNTLGPAGHSISQFGPELGAGFRLSDYLATNTLAFIKHAAGGTKLTTNELSYTTTSWYPGVSAADTASWGQEFTTFVQTVSNALDGLVAQGHTPQIAGMLWVQGEADATDAQAGAEYEQNLTLLISRVREQFGVPAMPFVYAQVLPYQTRTASVVVREAMANIDQDSGHPAAVTGAFMVPTEGMGEQGDDVHFNTPGQLALGQALVHSLVYRGMGGACSNKTVAYWQLDEGSNPTYLLDAAGTYHIDLSVNGTAASSLNRIANPDKAAFLDGTDPRVNAGALMNPSGVRRMYDEELDMRGEPFTFEGFFLHSAAPGTHTSYDVIAGTRSSLSRYHGWRVIMLNGQIRFFAVNALGRAASILTPSRYDDGWLHHFAATWNPSAGTTGEMSLYMDGGLVNSVPGVGDVAAGGSATNLFGIGAEITGTVESPQATGYTWEGVLDELRFTRDILAPAQFLNAGSGAAYTTSAYWRFDEATGDYVDSVGTNNLIRSNGNQNLLTVATITHPDASDSRGTNPASQTNPMAKGPHIPELDLTDNGGWTLEGYLRNASSIRQFIASNNPGGSSVSGAWDLEISYISAGQLTLRVADPAAPLYLQVTTTGPSLTDNEFHHWAITWSPSTTTMSLFVDGIPSASLSVPLQSATAATRLFFIGGFLLSTGSFHTSYMFQGELDEVRLSIGVLTPSEFLSPPPRKSTVILIS